MDDAIEPSISYPHQVPISNIPIPFYRNTLFILCGPSGSGKSTFAKRYFPPTMTVSTDVCRSMICDSPMNQKISDDAFDLFYFIIEKRLKNGYPTVADSTALRPKYRMQLQQLAQKYHYVTTLLLFDLPLSLCQQQDQQRRASVGEAVIQKQYQNLEQTRKDLQKETYQSVVVFHSLQKIGRFLFRWTAPLVECSDPGPFDLIGDVHGCYDLLQQLLTTLGYVPTLSPSLITPVPSQLPTHPQHRRLIFLGDIMDRGHQNLAVFWQIYTLWKAKLAYYIPGNHCEKLSRYLQGNPVKLSEDLQTTISEIQALSPEVREQFQTAFFEMFRASPPYLVLDHGQCVAVHAGIPGPYIGRTDAKVLDACMYGTWNRNPNDPPLAWCSRHAGYPLIVFGHIPVQQPTWKNRTLNIDLGAYQGGELCAFRYPEFETVSIHSQTHQITRHVYPEMAMFDCNQHIQNTANATSG